MEDLQKTDSLLRDRVYRLSESIISGVGATLVNAFILLVLLVGRVDSRRLVPWFGTIVVIGVMRLFAAHFFKRTENNTRLVRRYRTFSLLGLAVTGAAWGSTAFLIFPDDSIGHQVFIVFVLGGMVAGTVGIYSALLSAFFAFSIPTVFPMVVKLFLMDQQIYYGMGALLLIFWAIMLITALKLNRDITRQLLLKYENLDLISDLKAEVRVREAIEKDLKKKNLEIEGIVAQRTDELMEVNKKLIREIEERRLIAAALKENEEKYRELVESINDVIYASNEKASITYVSPVVKTVLGYEPEEFLGRDLRDFVHPDDRQLLYATLLKRRDGDIRPIEYRFRTKNNEYRWVRGSSRAIFKEGVFVGIRGILTDVSEKIKLEDQLRRSQKMEAVATISGGIAHDFNNLLAVILGNSELAMMEIGPDHSAQEFLENISATTNKAKTVVAELLSFSRRSHMEKKPVNIAEIVLDQLGRLETSLPPSIMLEKDIAKDIGTMFGDAAQIGVLLTNLWDNALDAMAESGGTLAVEVKRETLSPGLIDFDSDLSPGDYFRLTVKDGGCGIQPRNIERLFDPYYSTKDLSAGGGLGLAVVHGIVKRHGGGIRVTSAPGKGACFDVFFPAS